MLTRRFGVTRRDLSFSRLTSMRGVKRGKELCYFIGFGRVKFWGWWSVSSSFTQSSRATGHTPIRASRAWGDEHHLINAISFEEEAWRLRPI